MNGDELFDCSLHPEIQKKNDENGNLIQTELNSMPRREHEPANIMLLHTIREEYCVFINSQVSCSR